MNAATELLSKFITYIINPTLYLIFAAGFFLFLWGLVVFILNLNKGGDQADGKRHMLWGLVGMLVMISVGGILALIVNTFNLKLDKPDMSRIPSVSFFGSGR